MLLSGPGCDNTVPGIVCQKYYMGPACPGRRSSPLRPRFISEDGTLALVYFPATAGASQSQWAITAYNGGGISSCLTNKFLAVGGVVSSGDGPKRGRDPNLIVQNDPVDWFAFSTGSKRFDVPADITIQCLTE